MSIIWVERLRSIGVNNVKKLSQAQEQILQSLIRGATLKSHRYLDGTKIYKLHPLDGPASEVDRTAVEALKAHGLIHSNQKFPAATYLLTDKVKSFWKL